MSLFKCLNLYVSILIALKINILIEGCHKLWIMLSKACTEVRSMIYLEEWPYFITIKNKVSYTVKPGKVNPLFGNESYSKYWTKYPILCLYAVGHVKKKLGDKFDFCVKNQKFKKIVELFQMHIEEWQQL